MKNELNVILKEITLAGETVRKYQEYLEAEEEKLEGIAENALVKEINYQIDQQINNGNFVSSGESFWNFCLEDHLDDPNFKKEIWEDCFNPYSNGSSFFMILKQFEQDHINFTIEKDVINIMNKKFRLERR